MTDHYFDDYKREALPCFRWRERDGQPLSRSRGLNASGLTSFVVASKVVGKSARNTR